MFILLLFCFKTEIPAGTLARLSTLDIGGDNGFMGLVVGQDYFFHGIYIFIKTKVDYIHLCSNRISG